MRNTELMMKYYDSLYEGWNAQIAKTHIERCVATVTYVLLHNFTDELCKLFCKKDIFYLCNIPVTHYVTVHPEK